MYNQAHYISKMSDVDKMYFLVLVSAVVGGIYTFQQLDKKAFPSPRREGKARNKREMREKAHLRETRCVEVSKSERDQNPPLIQPIPRR